MEKSIRAATVAFCILGSLLFAAACTTLNEGLGIAGGLLGAGDSGALSEQTIAAGLKEALSVGSANTVAAVSKSGGYNLNPQIRIPLPENLQTVANTMRKIGLGGMVDQLQTKINEGAETAAAQAGPIFMDAVRGMSFQDVMGIFRGGPTAATDYFRGKTAAALKGLYAPVVRTKLQEAGAMQVYDAVMQKYSQIPLVPKPTVNLEDYATDQALNGLFKMLAAEEQNIRQNPAARTTELLRQVFGQPGAAGK